MNTPFIRQQIVKQRSQLNPSQITTASKQIFTHLQTLNLLESAQHIAGYQAIKGEIELNLIKEAVWQQQKFYYLPILHTNSPPKLQFARYQDKQTLYKNQFGILEPHATTENLIPTQQLDIVFVPLVAFDSQGHRIGMGKGYYDATFAFLRDPASLKKPLLIGLAHEFQKQVQIQPNPWDVDLDIIVTERQIYTPTK
jgi:5-formyltetrahydrofolate cyclo-ligase